MNLTSQKTAFLFPGQGSQALGMGKELASTYSIARETFEEADQILGFSLSKIMWDDGDALNDTANTQPALFVHSIASLRVFQRNVPNFEPVCLSGHSLGEITALCAARSISFSDGLKLVRRRGELMRDATSSIPGTMGAIIRLEKSKVEEVCKIASKIGISSSVGSIIGALVLLIISFFVLRRVDRSIKQKGSYKIRMTRILSN